MQPLNLAAWNKKRWNLLCLGAHSDDIEIGCGGTILSWLKKHPGASVRWCVFSGAGARGKEAQASAARFLKNAPRNEVILHEYRDGFFPHEGADIKEAFEWLKTGPNPDVILTHYRNDLHQDHRVISELTRNTWRDHLTLEYEIPKYDGDLDRPNVFVPIPAVEVRRKISLLLRGFPSQSGKHWFDEETFRALMRIRGVECNSPSRYAEAFHGFKTILP